MENSVYRTKEGSQRPSQQDLFDFLESEAINYEIECHHSVPKLTLKQQRYYQGVLLKKFAEGLYMKKDDIKKIVKQRFTVNGKNSSAEMNIIEMDTYCEMIRHWASYKFHVVLPEPNEEL